MCGWMSSCLNWLLVTPSAMLGSTGSKVNNELRTLINALQELIDERGAGQRLIVTADAQAAHQSVVRAMDAAGKVGLTRISITTQQPDVDE